MTERSEDMNSARQARSFVEAASVFCEAIR
jgi:hypothetical protein